MARGSLEDRSLAFAEQALEGRVTPAQEYVRELLDGAVREAPSYAENMPGACEVEVAEMLAEARRRSEAVITHDMQYLRALLAAAFHAGHVAGTEDHMRRGARR